MPLTQVRILGREEIGDRTLVWCALGPLARLVPIECFEQDAQEQIRWLTLRLDLARDLRLDLEHHHLDEGPGFE